MIFDCHLDLAMNAVHWNRDLTKSLDEIRARESQLNDKKDRGNSVVSFEELRKGGIRFCVATQIAHSVARNSLLQGWNSPAIAWAQTQAQLAWYQEMVSAGHMTHIQSGEDLVGFRETADESDSIAFILSLEGADSFVNLDYLHRAFAYGLRAIGPAHYGPGRYAAGTGETDGFTPLGFELLTEMSMLGVILDVTHLTDLGFDQALERFAGPILASHHNCRTLVDHQRQLTDAQIKRLAERNAIIGMAFDAWMLVPDWVRGNSTPQEKNVTLACVADHIDHVCQLVGNADFIAIGSDLDGGYGIEQTPLEIDSIARLGELRSVLRARNYSDEVIEKIFLENAFQFFRQNLAAK